MIELIVLFVVVPALCACCIVGAIDLAGRIRRACGRLVCRLAGNRRKGSLYPVTFWTRLGVV